MAVKQKWFSGPPPSVGWWPASNQRWDGPIRWWDGKRWSCAAYVRFNERDAADIAKIPSGCRQSKIEWQHRPASWPDRSRT